MTVATFYKNGFMIKEHTRPDICGELSMFTWATTTIMLNLEHTGEYVTDEASGYGHFIFNHENPTLAHIFAVCKAMLPVWANKFKWDGFLSIEDKDELLLPQAIVPTESAQA